MSSIAIDFLYTEDEYIRAGRKYLFMNETLSKFDLVLFPLILIFFVGYIIIYTANILSIVAITLSVMSFVAFCLMYLIQPHYFYRKTEKYHQRYNMLFTPEEIRFDTDTIHSHLGWSTYKSLWENGEFFYLIQQARIYAVIPKRAFSSEEDQNHFRDLVKSAGLEYRSFK